MDARVGFRLLAAIATVTLASLSIEAPGRAASEAATTIRASVSSAGTQGNGMSSFPVLSADGRYVAFDSSASNLVPHDTNGKVDVFVRDLHTGVTRRVSVANDGAQGNGDSDQAGAGPAISADGRYVAFQSLSTSLVRQHATAGQVYVRDLKLGTTRMVSVSNQGVPGENYSDYPSISADGRYVAFASQSLNLVPGGSFAITSIFVRDLQANTTRRVSVSSQGVPGNDVSDTPYISANGRYVTFMSAATNLVPRDTNALPDIFVRDLQANTTRRANLSTSGAQANDGGTGLGSNTPSISGTGRYIAFTSDASNLVPHDKNNHVDVFLRDMQTHTTRIVSVSSSNQEGNFDSVTSNAPAVSDDGQFVIFSSVATNLVTGHPNDGGDIYRRDMTAGATTLMSVSPRGDHANSQSYEPAISANGQYVAFSSDASNLVFGDTNGSADIFVRGRLV